MQDFLVILQPNTYMKKKQPQLLLVSRTANSIRLHRSEAACSRLLQRRRGLLAVAASMKGLPTWELAETPNYPTHVLRFLFLSPHGV